MSPGLRQVHKALAMAKSTGRDERSDKTEDEDEDEDEREDEREDRDEEAAADEDRDEGEEAKPAAREQKRAKAKRPVPRTPPPPAVPQQGGAMGKSLLLFVVIVGGLAAAFAILGQEKKPDTNWKPGSKHQVEITLVASDKRDLACLSTEAMNGRHCAFQAPGQPWQGNAGGPEAKPDDDKMLLRPYTTVDGIQFLAAGVWSEPALAGNLPLNRFSIKCSFNVDGNFKRPKVRWSPEGAWLDQDKDWLAGYVSECKMVGSTP